MSVWADITTDKEGHTIAKDLFKAWSFFAGLFYLLVLLPAVQLLNHEFLPEGPGVFLVAGSLGFQALKEGSNYLSRRTADDAGNPLVQPGTDPPEVMPQQPNPNAPGAPPCE